MENGFMGLALVLLALGLFLYARLAFWVAMGIPISILGSFALLPMLDGTINMVSMFAFLITLGIVVDDAIVVGENIYHKRQEGLPWLEASIEGVQEMAAPMVIAVTTNIVAFLPLLFAPGSTGKFFSILPVVVISVFTVSLIECLFILPAHLSTTPDKGETNLVEKREMFCDRMLGKFVNGLFDWLLRKVLVNRYPVTIVFLVGLALAYVYYDSGRINFSFRPRILADRIDAEVILPYGSPIEEVRKIARHLEESGMRAIEKGTAYTEIKRVDGKRVLNVTASVLSEIANENKVLTDLKKEFMPGFLARHSGLKYSFEGRDRDRRESLSSLAFGFVLTLITIMALLAILFGSYTQPLIVMVSIPLALANALLGHIIMGYDLSIISIFGLIALCGVVVNGGLILTDTANRFRERGMSPFDASLQAGLRRFRPIFLAAITTFFGLAPMIFETSVGARFLIPMAISLGFGIILSTPLILILTPALYMIYCDVAEGKKKVNPGVEEHSSG